jgi:hypothetical protein
MKSICADEGTKGAIKEGFKGSITMQMTGSSVTQWLARNLYFPQG